MHTVGTKAVPWHVHTFWLFMCVAWYGLLWWAHAEQHILGSPAVLLAMSIVFGAYGSRLVQRWIGAGRLDNRLVARLLLAFTHVTVFSLLAGWGCFSAGLATLIAGTHVKWSGSRTWWPTAVLAVGYTAVAQGLLLAGVAQSVLEPRHSHLVAVCVLAVVLISAFHLGASDRRREQAALSLTRTEQRFEALVRNSTDAIVVLDRDGLLTYASPTVQRFNRQSAEKLLGRPHLGSVHPEDRAAFEEAFTGLIKNGSAAQAQLDVRFLHADGDWRWFEVVLHNRLDDPAVAGVVANHRDVTQRRIDQEQLAFAATHDALTGLANRIALQQKLVSCLRAGNQPSTTVAIIDVDNFKEINDRLGHPAGDRLLTVVADRLRQAAGDALVARLGGDEFAVVVPSRAATDCISRVVTSMADPVPVAGELLHVQVSIGLAAATGDAVEPAELVRRADVAMYQAKHKGRNRWVAYTPAMDAAATERARIEQAIRQGLHHDRLRLLYQPVVSLPEGRLTGVEALIRLHDADGTVIGPDRFIPVAEATGLIVPIGRWVLRTACRQAADWRRRLGDDAPARVNINVSARQLDDPDLVTDISQALADTGLPAESLIIEITETVALSSDTAATTLHQLQAMGVGIALDDFGTGYSSLSLLMTCPVDVLKVDKSFVADIEHRPERAAVVRFLGHSATDLGVRLVAEGVETPTQATLLHQMGYQHAQGYHFARPLTADHVEAFIDRAAPRPTMVA